MAFSSVFENKQSTQSQRLFAIVKQAILKSLGPLSNRYTVRLIGFKKGSVVVETEIIPINPAESDSEQQAEVDQLRKTIEAPQFAQSFKEEVASQKTIEDGDFPVVDDQAVQVQGVVDTETPGRLKVGAR